ncbi:MAG: S49 family peptidase [Pseudomonadota bacterium]
MKSLWYKLPFTGAPKPTVVQVSLHGMIATENRTGRALNLETVEKALIRAFDVSDAKAVVISVNSPGGSPAQSRMIHDRVRELSAEKKTPVLSYIEDVGASGGYMISLAGDEIFADPYAIVGSIGVIGGGFGFQEAIKKLGIERRIYTSGENKSQLDPFTPEDERNVERFKGILSKTHDLFKDMVRDRRGGRLKTDDETLFNGDFWVAGDALDLGLIDQVGDLRALLKARFGDELEIKKISTDKKGLFSKLFASRSSSILNGLPEILSEISAWGRYGR